MNLKMNKNQYRHIIWDWNGTLFDDAWLCVEIINQLLRKRHLPMVDAVNYQRQFTFPVSEYYRALGFDFSRESFEVLAAEYVETYDRRRFECNLQPNAVDVLQAVAARGLTQSVLSAYEQSRLLELVAYHGVQRWFTHLIGLDDYYAVSKVDQGKRFLAEMECRPEEMVLVGDSLHDAEVAEAMGIDCVLIPSGHFSRERLLTCDAVVCDSLTELICGEGFRAASQTTPR